MCGIQKGCKFVTDSEGERECLLIPMSVSERVYVSVTRCRNKMSTLFPKVPQKVATAVFT